MRLLPGLGGFQPRFFEPAVSTLLRLLEPPVGTLLRFFYYAFCSLGSLQLQLLSSVDRRLVGGLGFLLRAGRFEPGFLDPEI